jgi:signal transduction histidine kinase
MQRQLARLDTARKQFIASASHELRTPIFSLGGFLELLEDEDLDEETRARSSRSCAARSPACASLATELLDLSRLESGALELRPEPTDVGQLAREVAGEFTPAVSAHGASCEVACRRATRSRSSATRARRAGAADPARQRARAHPEGTAIRDLGRARGRARHARGGRRGLGIRTRRCPHIFEPFFTSPTAPAAPASGSRSRASSPSACRAS